MEHQRIILAAGVLLVLVGTLAFLQQPSITGFVPTDTRSQPLRLEVRESQAFVLRSADKEPLQLTSFSISGSVAGDGLASVYLNTPQGSRLLVYSNIEKQSSPLAAITGMAVKELIVEPAEKLEAIEGLPPGYRVVSGGYEYACAETCVLSPGIFNQPAYLLEVIVTPGTVIRIDEIRFTVEG